MGAGKSVASRQLESNAVVVAKSGQMQSGETYLREGGAWCSYRSVAQLLSVPTKTGSRRHWWEKSNGKNRRTCACEFQAFAAFSQISETLYIIFHVRLCHLT